ncbi:hypothetical protein [Noviherbaspirillum sp. Root189]|uniref:hypothetical protein n=1 Tax=Noviherbaspirillum sp. Root189 TaxID=1736487 RepID=UPI0012E34356|nr:hypothetical protein [Noviherbaspirillum sp. Root189]
MERREYRLMQIVGIVVLCGAASALYADATLAAAISLVVGTLILFAGLVGAWIAKDDR